MSDVFITLDEVAARLRVSKITVMRWVRAGELPAAKLGKGWRISESTLNGWIEERTSRPRTLAELGWTREQALEARQRLGAFSEDWDVPGMDAYDEL